jgi:hypothetical protein
MPPPKPLASQADFDEAVSTNVDDFGMSRAEAVVAALEELKLQVRKRREKEERGSRSKRRRPSMMMMMMLLLLFLTIRPPLRYTKHFYRIRTSRTSSPQEKKRWRGKD